MFKWSEYSIRKQFMIALPILTIGSLVYIGISYIIYINNSNEEINKVFQNVAKLITGQLNVESL